MLCVECRSVEGETEGKVSRKRWIAGFAAVFVLVILIIGAYLIFFVGGAAKATCGMRRG